MKIRFYQTTWNGIDLVALSRSLGHPISELPNSRFYEAYYKKISQNSLSEDWKNKKGYQTEWLKKQIDLYGDNRKPTLSIGAGTAIVEIPLIKSGYNIHLQECQKESLSLFGGEGLTTCYYGGLNLIPQNEYNTITSIAMMYALDDNQLKNFFQSCATILKPGGTLILLDTSLSWREIYSHLRNWRYAAHNYLLWGFKRSVPHFLKLAKGFELLSQEYYDPYMKILPVKRIMQVPYNVTPHWQMMVFQKK
jgi:hypothetical protein